MYARMKVTLLDGSGAVINNATIANIIWDFIFYDETGARIDVNDHYTESGIADNHVTEHFNSTAFTRDTRDTRRGTNGIRYYNYKGSGDNILYEGKEAELFTYVIIPADISAEDFDLLKSLPGETFKILVEAQAVQTEYLTAADSSDPYGILDDLEAAAAMSLASYREFLPGIEDYGYEVHYGKREPIMKDTSDSSGGGSADTDESKDTDKADESEDKSTETDKADAEKPETDKSETGKGGSGASGSPAESNEPSVEEPNITEPNTEQPSIDNNTGIEDNVESGSAIE